MAGDRAGAIERARQVFDDGSFVARLAQLVACPTESQVTSRRDELYRYCTDIFGPLLRQAGFETQVHDNPRAEFGPILIGTRIDGDDRGAATKYYPDQFGIRAVGILQGGAGDSGNVDSAFAWWLRPAWAGRARPRDVVS